MEQDHSFVRVLASSAHKDRNHNIINLKFNNQPLLQKINKKDKTGAEHVTLVYQE